MKQLLAACDVPTSVCIDVFNRAFDGYIGGNIQFTTPTFFSFIAQQGIDLSLSRVLEINNDPAALALVTRRGTHSRLAAMAVAPEAQGQGAGTYLVQQLLNDAKQRHDQRYELEVITQNTAGVKLYTRCGFTLLEDLVGFQLDDTNAQDDALTPLEHVTIHEVARQVMCYGRADLPWQVSAASFVMLTPPHVALKHQQAYAIISNPAAETIHIKALVVAPEARRQGQARALLQQLRCHYPQKNWRVTPVCPDSFAPVFDNNDFQRTHLTQQRLHIPL